MAGILPDPQQEDENSVGLGGLLGNLQQGAGLARQIVPPMAPAPVSSTPGIEKIVTPAVLVSGKVYTGAFHPDALEAASNATKIPFETLASQREGLDGFLTSFGRYVTREEANKITNLANQPGDPGYIVNGRLSGESMTAWPDEDVSHFLKIIDRYHGKEPAK